MSKWESKKCPQGPLTIMKRLGDNKNELLIAITHHKEFDHVLMQVVAPGLNQNFKLKSQKFNDICREADEKAKQLLQDTIAKHQIFLSQLKESLKEEERTSLDNILKMRDCMKEEFKQCKTEKDLNEVYDNLRDHLVCEMSDRAEEIGLNPDTI